MAKRAYQRVNELSFKMLTISLIFSVILFLFMYFARFPIYFQTLNDNFITYASSARYSETVIYAFVLNTLSIMVECSNIYLLHDNLEVILLAIVIFKLTIGILAAQKMAYYYGADGHIMLIFAFTEGSGIVASATEIIYKLVWVRIEIKRQKAQEKADRKNHRKA